MVNQPPAERGLLRAIGRWDLIALAINCIVGAGIFGLPSEAFRLIGAWSLLAFLVCAVVAGLIILCFAEVGSRFDGTGGPYLYARAAFGPLIGFEVGWLILLARLTAFAANCNLLVGYLGFFVPELTAGVGRAAVITVVVGTLTAVNYTGVRNAATMGNIFTVAKLVPLLLFIGVGLFFVRGARFDFSATLPVSDLTVAVLLLVYAFSGFEMVGIPGGEAKNPRRDLPRALVIALPFVAIVYFLIQLVAIGTLPGLAASGRPLADAGSRFLGPVGGAIISLGAIVSIYANLNVVILVCSRLFFAMGERHELPGLLARTHPVYRTPHVALLVTAAIVLVLTISGTFVYAVAVSVIARLLSYGATCAALPALRRRPGVPEAQFRVAGGSAVAVAALVLIVWLLSHSTWDQAKFSALAAAVGLVIFAWQRRRARSPHPEAP